MVDREYLKEREDDSGVIPLKRTMPFRNIDNRIAPYVSEQVIKELGNDYMISNPVRLDIYLNGHDETSIRFTIEHLTIDPKTNHKIGSGIIGFVYASDEDDPSQTKIYEMTPREMLEDNQKYTQKFPYIFDDTFLVATVDPKTNYQKIYFQKVSSSSYPRELFDEDFYLKNSNIMLRYKYDKELEKSEIFPKLGAVEKNFIGFKKAVQEIAEAGWDSFSIKEIEFQEYLFLDLMQINRSFLIRYLNRIRRLSKKGGNLDVKAFRDRLDIMLRAISAYDFDDEYYEYCNHYRHLDHGFPFIPMSEADEDMIMNCLLRIARTDPEYLFKFDKVRLQRYMAVRSEFDPFRNFQDLFQAKDSRTRLSLLYNSVAKKMPFYETFVKSLFNDKNEYIRSGIAKYPGAVSYPEFKALFKDKDWHVRSAIAENIYAVNFPEYKELFQDPHYAVRRSVYCNPMATRFEEYGTLIPTREFRPDKEVWRKKEHYPEYKLLFTDAFHHIRQVLAMDMRAVEHPEYVRFFSDPDSFIRECAAYNWLATRLPEYVTLFNDSSEHIREISKKQWSERDKIKIDGKSIYEYHDD